MATLIESDSQIPVDLPFKVSAGPGAGKTHWLSLHIQDVISHTKKLGITRKIACISYTNVGANTILERLSNNTGCVEVCTIHSFLYNYVVKPFLHLEADSFGLDPYKIKVVPIEPFLTRGFAELVLNDSNLIWVDTDRFLEGLCNDCRWRYKDGKFGDYKPKYPIKNKINGQDANHNVPQKAYNAFVNFRWKNGLLSYDDVIYLAIEILQRQPNVFKILSAKFPFFFIDEFQDSTPPIVDFTKALANYGVVIGVVGDKAQTIYDFIGASVQMFDSFNVDGMTEYEIHGNRRSTPEIVSLLNAFRPNFIQKAISQKSCDVPVIIIGERLNAYQKAIELCEGKEVHTLAFPNIIANSMKYHSDNNEAIKNLIDSDFDNNYLRGTIIKTLIKAVEYAFNYDLLEAWHQLDLLNDDRSQTIVLLRQLLNNREQFVKGSLFEFYEYIKTNVYKKLPSLKTGKTKSFYLNNTYMDMAISMKISDCASIHKTIHKAKGEEYDNVMLLIDNPKDVNVFLSPDLDNNSTHRVYYVGMSRAKRTLFVNFKELAEDKKLQLAALPIKIIDIE